MLLSSLVLANKWLNDRICSNRRWARWLRADGITPERITVGERDLLSHGLGYSLGVSSTDWSSLVSRAASLAKEHERTLGIRQDQSRTNSLAAAIRAAAKLSGHGMPTVEPPNLVGKRKAEEPLTAASLSAYRLFYPLAIPTVQVRAPVAYLTPPVTPETSDPSPLLESLLQRFPIPALFCVDGLNLQTVSLNPHSRLLTPPGSAISPALTSYFV